MGRRRKVETTQRSSRQFQPWAGQAQGLHLLRHDRVNMSELATMSERARFVFTGRLRTDSFVEFARHRAARLGLWIDVAQMSDEAITVNVSGAAELVDAFEM